MKKILFLLSATLLTLNSCSNDDNNSSDDNKPTDPTLSILPKTITDIYPSYPADNSSSTLVYNGNKIVSYTDSNSRSEYTYEGNVIVKMVDYDTENGKNSKQYEESYTYANGKLATCTTVDNFSSTYPTGGYKSRYVYTYNTDGTVKRESYVTDFAAGGVEKEDPYTLVFTFANGNLVKQVRTQGKVGNSDYYQATYVYEYDTKNNPMKNILGFNLLLENDVAVSANNLIKKTTSSVSGANSTTTTSIPQVYVTKYEYNANGFPTKATNYKSDGTTISNTTDYTY